MSAVHYHPLMFRVTCQDTAAGTVPPDTLLEIMRVVAGMVRSRVGGTISVACIGEGNPILAIEWDGRAVTTARVE